MLGEIAFVTCQKQYTLFSTTGNKYLMLLIYLCQNAFFKRQNQHNNQFLDTCINNYIHITGTTYLQGGPKKWHSLCWTP